MIKFFIRLINNPRIVIYVILFYLIISFVFSFFYFSILPLIEGISSLSYNKPGHPISFVQNYFDCFYFSITCQTTVGFGDIIPYSFWGRVITSVQAVFGYFYLAFAISIFSSTAILKSNRFNTVLVQYMDTVQSN